MASFNLILGDQLFSDISMLPVGPVVMVEDRAIAGHFKYHSHKLVLTFAAMRHFAAGLGARAVYYPMEMGVSIFDALRIQKEAGFDEVFTFEPADRFFGKLLSEWCQEFGLNLVVLPNPLFLTSLADWEDYTAKTDRRLMADFYKSQRQRLEILVDEKGQPTGGKWSFDTENRRNLPRGHVAPYVHFPEPDLITREVIELVRDEFGDHVGDPGDFSLPVTHLEAREFLQDFLEERFDQFGDFEDAISSDQHILYHSFLSPLMNVGLVTPREIIDAALRRHAERPVPLNCLEGFIRQIIGWREFVRGIHRENLWDGVDRGSRVLGPEWYAGTTGLPPLDLSIQRAMRSGWCHHIERLMVLGSVMFMCDVREREVNRYFMEMFVDAAEWVMEPNVFGMSQFVSPTFATKPYISGSAYILKMSDFKKGEWCDVWDGLYWKSVDRLKDDLAKNHRMFPVLRGLERLEPVRRDRIFAAATAFIDRTTVAV